MAIIKRKSVPAREPKFVHLNIRVEQSMADYLRSRADASMLDVSKEVRRLVTAAMRAEGIAA